MNKELTACCPEANFASKFIYMKTKLAIHPETLKQVAEKLNFILADEFVLYVKTLNAHWNVEGNDFYPMHLFFEMQYKELIETIDSVAERIRTLGHYAPATLSEFKELTHLTEQSRQQNNSKGFIESLLEDHIAVISMIRGYIQELENHLKEAGTLGFLSTLIETHEKMAWKLRAHL